jgi:formate dehydrogenase gamma subunit
MRYGPAIAMFLFLATVQSSAAREPQALDCLSCHGDKDVKDKAGHSVYVDQAKRKESVHGILGCTDCHTTIKEFPHPPKIARVECATCHADESSSLPNSIHAGLGEQACQLCHGNAHEIKSAAQLTPAKCAECHSQEVKDFVSSSHGLAAKSGDRDAPNCFSCHGPVHKIVASTDPVSSVAKKNLADTCATCHANSEFLSRHNISIVHPVELYRQSVHGRAVARGNNSAATCSDCHSSHAIFPSRDQRSKINHWNVAATCGKCHVEIQKTYLTSIHGQSMQTGNVDSPVCTDCHGEHLILAPSEPASLVNASRVSSVTCGRCHSDERLELRYNLPADRVPSYADSYHGLALREGSQTVANCASCHGVHNIYRSTDSRSTVNVTNLSKTCGACHAGAGESFAIGPVHVRTGTGPAHPVVKWIRWIYWILIPFTLGFMVLHNFTDFLSKLIRQRPKQVNPQKVLRMNIYFRIAHWGVVLSFPTLVITGFALKYPDSWWANPLLILESRFAFRGTLHRAAAVVLMPSTFYHLLHLAVNRRDRAFLKYMLPKFGDLGEMVDVFRYNLGLTDQAPTFGKFNYAEKMEYRAFLWGAVVMTLTGFLLWFNNFTLRHFPKWVSDASTAVHFYEAILATFSILIWHFYMVVFDPDVYPMDLAWITGKVPAEHYRHTRPGYLRELERENQPPVSSDATPASSGDSGADGKNEHPGKSSEPPSKGDNP